MKTFQKLLYKQTLYYNNKPIITCYVCQTKFVLLSIKLKTYSVRYELMCFYLLISFQIHTHDHLYQNESCQIYEISNFIYIFVYVYFLLNISSLYHLVKAKCIVTIVSGKKRYHLQLQKGSHAQHRRQINSLEHIH